MITARLLFTIHILCLTCVAPMVAAQAEEPTSRPADKAVDPSFVEVNDDPALPRVLLIGDSISIGYTIPVRELLKGKANIHRPAANCGPTKRGLAQLDKWLGDGRWD